ncbi:MAG: hypothetical protein WAM14_13345, partial [Candidatus Nitrosopolaris sp.]
NPEGMKTELVQIADRGDRETGAVAYGIALNFAKLSKPIKDLLFELIPKEISDENVSKAIHVITAITFYFEYISVDYVDHVKSILCNLAYNTYTTIAVVQQIATHFDKLPSDIQKIIFDFADDEHAIAGAAVSRAITANYDRLPSNVRDLLFKMTDKKNSAESLKYVLETNPYSKVPENIKNELLNRMREKDAGRDT